MRREWRDFAFKPRTDIDPNPTTTQKGGRESTRIISNCGASRLGSPRIGPLCPVVTERWNSVIRYAASMSVAGSGTGPVRQRVHERTDRDVCLLLRAHALETQSIALRLLAPQVGIVCL